MIGVLFAIVLVQFIFVLYTISQADDLYMLASDIQSIMIIFLFAIFVYVVVIYNYLPYRLQRSINLVRELIDNVSGGNYHPDIDSTLFDQDEDFQSLILSLQKMLGIISRFDSAKAEKIFEHNQRIAQLINLVPQMVIITNINSEIVYINDKFRARFPNISEMNTLTEVILDSSFYEEIFAHMIEALRYGNNIYDNEIVDSATKRVALLKGSIVRNRKGNTTGAVFTVDIKGEEKQD
jgi:signal transduction histidine kinase